jgi:hypothetical protein
MKYLDYCLFFLPILDWNNKCDEIDEYEAPVIVKINAAAIPTKPAPSNQTLYAEFTWDQYARAAKKVLHLTDTQVELEKDSFLRDIPVMLNHVSRDAVIDGLGFEKIAA